MGLPHVPSHDTLARMPLSLKRFQATGGLHFITFSCYRRRPLLRDPTCNLFEATLEQVRQRFGFYVLGYVIMPEHAHLLVSEPVHASLATALQVLKQTVSRKAREQGFHTGESRFWQIRYYDFNVATQKKRIEKLRYLHRNPVTRGLVENPEDWPWSSFRHYLTGEPGTVEIESEWTEERRRNTRFQVKAEGAPS
jgi:putative transposase